MRTVSISGDLGSGKSTVARILSERLSLPLLSTGALHREIAAQRNLSTLELNAVATNDPTIDRLVDGKLMKLNESDLGAVVDSRMGWWFIPRALKVHLLVSPRVGASRAHLRVEETERYRTAEAATSGIIRRAEIERERFLEKYGVDIRSLRNYDVVIDTSTIAPMECADIVIAALSHGTPHEVECRPATLLLPPSRIYPTERITALRDLQEEARLLLSSHAYLTEHPVPVVYRAPVFVAVDGHKRTSSAILGGRRLVPCTLVGEGAERLPLGLSADDIVRQAAHEPSRWYDWEDAHGLQLEPPSP